MREPAIPLEWRFLAGIWRYAWGNNSDFAVDRIGGKQIGQHEFAIMFGVDKRRISDRAVVLRRLDYLKPDTGHMLYPVDAPNQEQPQTDAKEQQTRVRTSTDFMAFCEEWKVQASADFRALESAEAVVSRLRLVRLGQYKQWKTHRTNGGPSLYSTPQPNTQLENTTTTAVVGSSLGINAVVVLPAPDTQDDPVPRDRDADITVTEVSMAIRGEPLPAPAETKSLAVVPRPPTFQALKSLYPQQVMDEPNARLAFDALSLEEKQKAIDGLAAYLTCDVWSKLPKFIPFCSNYLKKKYYDCTPTPLRPERKGKFEEEAKSIREGADLLRAFRGGAT